MTDALKAPWRTFHRTISEMDATELAIRLTLVYLLLKPPEVWFLHSPMLVLAAAALLAPRLGRSPTMWLLITLLGAAQVVWAWDWIDNHQYLIVYWCLAIFLCLRTDDPARGLALNGRLLIAAPFAFALVWKLFLTSDFAGGHLFRELLLTDPRFQRLGGVLGMTASTRMENEMLLGQLSSGRLATGTLVEPASHVLSAKLMTWWTILTESAIVIAFLLPGIRLAAGLRDVTLLAFCWTAYSFGSVTGFGWLLLIMGIAQCPGERKRARFMYLLTFVVVLIYARTPWSNLLVRLFGS